LKFEIERHKQLSEAQIRFRIQIRSGQISGEQVRVSGSGDHGGVVGGKG
jgi:hypothetical protein